MNNSDSGAGSLRQAILDACDGSTITFAGSVTSPITLTTGELAIDKNLTITGPGASALTISGNNASRVFHITSAAIFNVTLSGLTIANGNATIGGGILDDANSGGTLTITNSTISGNTASQGGGIASLFSSMTITNSTISGNTATVLNGGGIFSSGSMTITNSTISGNTATGDGGGIFNFGSMTITNGTISANTGTADGGGIFSSGSMTITNSTISGNTGTADGGGIFNDGLMTITDSTISGNTANADGGGIFNEGTVNVKNTIVAGNSAAFVGADGFGDSFVSGGHNLIGDGTNTNFTNGVNGDQVGSTASPINPKLGPLTNNGGPTLTMALLAGSPAIDAGDDSVLGSPLFLTTDQRGAGFPRKFGSHVDIGAFEVQCIMVTVNPVNQTLTGGSVNLMAAATGNPTPTVQWQVSTDGGVTFTNIPGATSTTLSFTPTPSQSRSQYRAVFTNGCGTATTTAATLTVLDACLKDNSTGNLLQWNSTTGQYKFTRCSDGFMLTGTGTVGLVNGIKTLTDFKSDRRISAGLNTGQLTGSATIYLQVVQGVWQTLRIIDTNPAATCSCGP